MLDEEASKFLAMHLIDPERWQANRRPRRWPGATFGAAWGRSTTSRSRVAGLPRFRLYDLRHTFATHLLGQGAPITYVAAQLGHAKPTTTLAFYAHWIPWGDKRWINRLEALRAAGAVSGGSKTVAERGQSTSDASQLPYTTSGSRGSSEAEQLIRNQ